jgi:multidrug transporter EmrE-like cation transporter
LTLIIMMFGAIALNVCGHSFLKAGMNRIGAINPSQIVTDFPQVVLTPFVILGLASYVASVALYIVVLSRTDLSYAYPLLMSIGYVLIVLVSFLLFREPFSAYKWVGIVLILVGVILVGK